MNQLRASNSSRHFLGNLFQDYEVDPANMERVDEPILQQLHRKNNDSSRSNGAVAAHLNTASGGLITKNALAQAKNETYDYLNHKLNEIHGTYSQKIEILSNFMMLAQDEIRDVKSNKNDWLLRQEEIKLLIDQREQALRDTVH
jgi:hypothetical protein